jgi:HlyD family secretion protein
MGEDRLQDGNQPRLPKLKEISERLPKLPTAAVVVGTIGILGLTVYGFNQYREASQPKPVETPAAPADTRVPAIGRLEPEGEIITIAAPSSSQESKIARLLVEEGDEVSAGQLIAVLDNTDKLSAALDKAQADVQVAESEYADAQTGGEPGDIAAQEAKVASSRAELRGQTGIDVATINRLRAELVGENKARTAAIARLEAELSGDDTSQAAAIARLQAELAGEKKTQAATLARLRAELAGENKAQQATIDRLQNEIVGESGTQQATINRILAQVKNADVETRRYRNLYREGAVSASRLDSEELELKTLQEQLTEATTNRRKTIASLEKQIQETQANRSKTASSLAEQIQEALATRNKNVASLEKQIAEAQANRQKSISSLQQQIAEAQANRSKSQDTLAKQIEEARANSRKNAGTIQQDIAGNQGTLDALKNPKSSAVRIALSKLQSARATLKQSKADLEAAYVRSPINGRIFKVNTRPGEKVNEPMTESTQNVGIVTIGQTDRMIVTAEVDESNITKVKEGQKVTIVSDSKAFNGEIIGTVKQIGLEIGKKDVLDTDPAADVDSRVVEVKIALSEADSKKVAGLTNSKVIVKISI